MAVQVFFRHADPEQLSQYAELGGGLAHRLVSVAKDCTATTLSEWITHAATKRFTNARLLRAVWYGMCGVRPEDLRTPPAYTRLLGCSRHGQAYLRTIRRTAPLPVLTKPSDIPTTPDALRQATLEQAFASLYTLTMPQPREAGFFLRATPYVEKD